MAAGCRGPEASKKEVTVLAASSLKESFEALAKELMRGGLEARISFAGSQELAAQLAAGAPGDVFCCAGHRSMDQLVERELVEKSEIRMFAANKLAVVFRKDLRPPLDEIGDLQRGGLRVVLGAPEVPVGKAAQAFLDKAGLKIEPASLEASDLALLAKVRLGEADAAVVYASDVGKGELPSLSVPDELNVRQPYYAAPLKAARNRAGAEAFIETLLDPGRGKKLLEEAGFESRS